MADDQKDQHKIIISGPIINFNIEVDGVVAAQVYQGLAKLASKGFEPPESTHDDKTQSLVLGQMSPQEYLIEVHAKTNPEKILAFAQLLKDGGISSVETGELRLQFQKASEPVPANFKRDFIKAVRSGWIARGTNEKYYVTNLGTQALESKFSIENKTGSKTVRTRKAAKPLFIETPLRKEIEQMVTEPTFVGFPDYHDLSKGADKILWLLAKAKSLGQDKLNQKEVTFLSEKIGDYIPRKSISSLAIPHIRVKRLYMPIENGVRYLKILDEGEKYLKSLKK